jgi:hypothetical protein
MVVAACGGDAPPSVELLPDAGTSDDSDDSSGPVILEAEAGVVSDLGLGSTIDFDPDRVYVVGTIFGSGKSWYDTAGRIICDPADPDVVMGAIPAANVFATGTGLSQLVIRPGSHDLFYADDVAAPLRVLRSDPYFLEEDGTPESHLDWILPGIPENNDPRVLTPGCDSIHAFLLGPLDGALYYQCPGAHPGGPWYRNGSERWAPCSHEEDPNPLSVSEEGAVLCTNSVVHQGDVQPIASADGQLPPELSRGVLRAKPGGGFWGVLRSDDLLQRWTISREGALTFDGTYAAFPSGTRMGDERALDASGALYHLGWAAPEDDGTADDIVVRLSADFSAAEVVYAGYRSGNPLCRISRILLTGP